ncbi:AaceriAER180Wp [[Ashbya] aceris (nom. inval.)]|nr:AaceriAER180Wp [[Ashbya] aceris (nom. inval.)]
MAKSLRAKTHLKAKSVKRKGVFQKTADARAQRLAEKMKSNLLEQKAGSQSDGKMEIDGDSTAQTEKAAKVSTSGWRDARHLNYKRAKKLRKTKHKGSFVKF